MAITIIIVVCLIVIANFAASLRMAYKMALDADGGGYPIFGDAVANLLLLVLATVLPPYIGHVPDEVRIGLGVAAVVVPALHVYSILHFTRSGDRRRVEARAVSDESHE